jgi:hypothetical protein
MGGKECVATRCMDGCNEAGCLSQSKKGTPSKTVVALHGTGPVTLLDGTLPLRPFHPDGFVGSLEADGQQVRVAALACDDEWMIAISLVGFDTSIGVVLARFWSSTSVAFTPGNAWQEKWQGPAHLKRSIERYKQCVAHLEGTREVHALALVRTAHLTEGILHPPDLPEMREKPSVETDQARRYRLVCQGVNHTTAIGDDANGQMYHAPGTVARSWQSVKAPLSQQASWFA